MTQQGAGHNEGLRTGEEHGHVARTKVPVPACDEVRYEFSAGGTQWRQPHPQAQQGTVDGPGRTCRGRTR